jgi:hypothetical protein
MGIIDKEGVWHPDFPGDIVSIANDMPIPETPITVCAHCRKPLTCSEVKATFEGTMTLWDKRAKRCNVTLDYCADGLHEIEESIMMSAREAQERADKIKQMDEEDSTRIKGRPT